MVRILSVANINPVVLPDVSFPAEAVSQADEKLDLSVQKLFPGIRVGAGQGVETSNRMQNGLELSLGYGLGQQMSHLSFRLLFGSDGSCPLTDDRKIDQNLNDEDTHSCAFLVRGVVEQSTYVGGVTEGFLCTGGTPQTGTFNIYELDVDEPPQRYLLNAGQSGISDVFAINYKFQIKVKNGTQLKLHANSIDEREITNGSG